MDKKVLGRPRRDTWEIQRLSYAQTCCLLVFSWIRDGMSDVDAIHNIRIERRPEPLVLEALSRPGTKPSEIRWLCKASRYLAHGSWPELSQELSPAFWHSFGRILYDHAKEFCEAKRDKRYPQLREEKKVEFLSRLLATFSRNRTSAGRSLRRPIRPATAEKLFRKTDHGSECHCWKCRINYVKQFSGKEFERAHETWLTMPGMSGVHLLKRFGFWMEGYTKTTAYDIFRQLDLAVGKRSRTDDEYDSEVGELFHGNWKEFKAALVAGDVDATCEARDMWACQ